MDTVKLIYQHNNNKGGAKDHFWHFAVGYLLPSLHHILVHCDSERTNTTMFIFEDCGPHMNPLTEEMANLLSIEYCIDSTTEEEAQTIFMVPRWNLLIRRSISFVFYRSYFHTDFSLRRSKNFWKRLRRGLMQLPQSYKLKKDMIKTKKAILARTSPVKLFEKRDLLILRRSDMPAYYSENGAAKNKGYGNSRRALINLEEGLSYFKEQGLSAIIYEPGQHSFIDQIKTFHQSSGFIAIRGAEFANLLWLEPGSTVVMINTKGKPSFHIYNYCCMLGIKLIERNTQERYPNIQNFKLDKLIKLYA